MKCKNCNHDIYVDGIDKNQTVAHFNLSGGTCKVCIECGCDKPERRRKPVFCKNCGHEIVKRKDEWLHLHIYSTSSGRGIPNRPLQHQRLTVPHCYGTVLDSCGCTNAEVEE